MSSQSVSLDGRVALVTGASRGIGRGIARRLARAGARVALTARSLDVAGDFQGTLVETVELIESAGGRAFALKADLEDPADRDSLVERTVAEAGRLDILVNAAGFAQYATVETMSDDVFEATFDHYLRAPFKLAQAAIPVMRSQGEGWIVNVGSVTAERPEIGISQYYYCNVAKETDADVGEGGGEHRASASAQNQPERPYELGNVLLHVLPSLQVGEHPLTDTGPTR